jgi:hypothetical protein
LAARRKVEIELNDGDAVDVVVLVVLVVVLWCRGSTNVVRILRATL